MTTAREPSSRAAGTQVRLLDAAMRLFAERGYAQTTVGDIEQEAGLAPRSGALYQHFASKETLLHAAIERQLEAVDDLQSVMEMLPLGDLRSELMLVARWNLASLERRSDLALFIRREGDRLPQPLRDKLFDRLVARPYAQVVGWIEARAERAGVTPPDAHALALIMIEPMSAYRSMRLVFGHTPGDVDDERLIATWVDVCLAYAREAGLA